MRLRLADSEQLRENTVSREHDIERSRMCTHERQLEGEGDCLERDDAMKCGVASDGALHRRGRHHRLGLYLSRTFPSFANDINLGPQPPYLDYQACLSTHNLRLSVSLFMLLGYCRILCHKQESVILTLPSDRHCIHPHPRYFHPIPVGQYSLVCSLTQGTVSSNTDVLWLILCALLYRTDGVGRVTPHLPLELELMVQLRPF